MVCEHKYLLLSNALRISTKKLAFAGEPWCFARWVQTVLRAYRFPKFKFWSEKCTKCVEKNCNNKKKLRKYISGSYIFIWIIVKIILTWKKKILEFDLCKATEVPLWRDFVFVYQLGVELLSAVRWSFIISCSRLCTSASFCVCFRRKHCVSYPKWSGNLGDHMTSWLSIEALCRFASEYFHFPLITRSLFSMGIKLMYPLFYLLFHLARMCVTAF